MADSLALGQDNKLATINKKIIEIKKKIQLSEGQRKANFEECDGKIRESSEKFINLKKDIKTLQIKYSRVKNNEEIAEKIAQTSRESSATVRKQGLVEAAARADEDNIRLRKKFDLVKYKSETQQKRLAQLLLEYEELISGKMHKEMKKKLEDPLKKKIVSLENQLHRVGIMQMEADTVRKKYRSVRASLKADAAFYISSLKDLEENIKEQDAEMKRLQKVKKEAAELRDMTRETLTQQEVEAMQKSKERDNVILDYRQRVEDRKLELERLERMIFPAIRLPPQQDDFEHREKPEESSEGNDEPSKDEMTSIEEAFTKLRSATGVTRNEEVLDRFLSQRATKEKLQKMRTAMEDDKINLEKQRQKLTTEIEMQKFSETKEANQNVEKLSELVQKISKQTKLQMKFNQEYQQIQEIINEISNILSKFYEKFQEISDSSLLEIHFDELDLFERLIILNERIKIAIVAMGGPEEYEKWILEISKEQLDATSDGSVSDAGKLVDVMDDRSLFPRFPSSTTPAAPIIPSEDEEEVPTRSILKRQAQLLIETKSRRKAFNFRR